MSTPLRRRAALATGLLLAGLLAPPAGASPAGPAAAGVLTGRLTDAGAPVSGAVVVLQQAIAPITVTQTFTDSAGLFRFDVAAGRYKVRFDMQGGLSQYHPQRASFFQATTLTVADGQQVAIEEQTVPHGSVGGRVTTSAGAPAANAFVALVQANGAQVATTGADLAGRYVFPFVAIGAFQLNIGPADARAPRQWAHQKRTRAEADPVAVVAGRRTTVDEQLLPVGRISGLFTSGGAPVRNVAVQAKSLRSAAESVPTATGGDGRFTLQAFPGRYKVLFRPPGTLDQWATGKQTEWQADVITLEPGGEVRLEEKAMPTGQVRGRLIDGDGQGVAFAAVVVENPSLDRRFEATTDAEGVWFARVWPGGYRVRFETSTQAQWAHGKSSPGEADAVQVVAGETTVVDDKLAAPGSLTVAAVDARTGEPVSSFCVNAHTDFIFSFACTEDGAAEFEELGAGDYTVVVTDQAHVDNTTTAVRVRGGEATELTARLAQGATIAVTVTDASTGEPVDGVCVNGRPAERAEEYGEFLEGCTDSTGTISLTRVVPDRYVFFASTFGGYYGAQWVGAQGGVGAQTAAQVITAQEGVESALSVRMDTAGTLAGVITDEATGLPVENAEILAGRTGAATGPDGAYQLEGLGPYQWVIYFGHHGYAGQWPGGGGNRLAADSIPVRSGETTGYDVVLRKGSTLTGRITGPAGQPPQLAEVSVVNAKTFDLMHHAVVGADGVYTAPLTGPQEVKMFVFVSVGALTATMWYPGSPGFGGGQAISIGESGTTVVDIPVLR